MNLKNYNQYASMVVGDLAAIGTALAAIGTGLTGALSPGQATLLGIAGVVSKAGIALAAAQSALAPVSAHVVSAEQLSRRDAISGVVPQEAIAVDEPVALDDDDVLPDIDDEGASEADVAHGLHPSE